MTHLSDTEMANIDGGFLPAWFGVMAGYVIAKDLINYVALPAYEAQQDLYNSNPAAYDANLLQVLSSMPTVQNL